MAYAPEAPTRGRRQLVEGEVPKIQSRRERPRNQYPEETSKTLSCVGPIVYYAGLIRLRDQL